MSETVYECKGRIYGECYWTGTNPRFVRVREMRAPAQEIAPGKFAFVLCPKPRCHHLAYPVDDRVVVVSA